MLITAIKINSINPLNPNNKGSAELLAIIKYIFEELYKF